MLYKDTDSFPQGDFYLARASANFAEFLAQQAQQVYTQMGLRLPVAATSTFDLIAEKGQLSIADVARALGRSHQSASQQVKTLHKAGLLEVKTSEQDARARLYVLTADGRTQHELLKKLKAPIEEAYRQLFEELGFNLTNALEQATSVLSAKPLPDRIAEH